MVGEKTPVNEALANLKEAKTKDPWEHRSERMKCSSCIWFVLKGASSNLGRCRRRSPSMNGYPAAFTNDWCGDHKLDENKV